MAGSIYDELYKRRRAAKPKHERPTFYACESAGLTLVDAWYATAAGMRHLNDEPLPATLQAAPQFEPALTAPCGQYRPVYRVNTASPPLAAADQRRWQLLDEVIQHAMARASAPEWQDARLVIHLLQPSKGTGEELDAWLRHWPSHARPRDDVEMTTLPLFDWLAERLAVAQDTHAHVCFIAIEAIDPRTPELSPGESATVLWLERWQVGKAKPAQGVELLAPVFGDPLADTGAGIGLDVTANTRTADTSAAEPLPARLAELPPCGALVWDGHHPAHFKPLLNALPRIEALSRLDGEAFWSLTRLSGTLHHYDALHVVLAAHAVHQQQCVGLALSTHDPTRLRTLTLRPATASSP